MTLFPKNSVSKDSWWMVGAIVVLFISLWLLAIPLSLLPSPVGPAAQQFAEGARIAVQLTVISGVFGIILGMAAGLGKLSTVKAFRYMADAYVWVFRGTPLLTQILFFYSVSLPGDIKLPEFWAAVVALSFNVGAYNAEVIRSGVLAVPHGQTNAARALGLNPIQAFRYIIMPQAFKVSLPPLANNIVALLKDSSLAYAIGVVELNMIAQRVGAESFQPVPVFMAVALIYLLLTSILTQFTAALERQMSRGYSH